jgi:hypothetical protein
MIDNGWDGLVQDDKKPNKLNDLDVLYGQVFKTQEGQKVLNHLRSITIEQPSWNPGEDASYGYVRTGMAEIVRMIEKRIARSENG